MFHVKQNEENKHKRGVEIAAIDFLVCNSIIFDVIYKKEYYKTVKEMKEGLKMDEKRTIDWGSLILGILFVLVSLLSFQDPVGNLVAIVVVFAIFAFIKGIFELFVRNRLKKLTGYKGKMPLIIGIIDILVGVFFLFNIGAGVAALPFVFAVWFIADSVLALFTADLARGVSEGYYWFTIIVNILGILLGIFLLFNPISSALTLSFLVGFYFMLFGITHIAYAFR